MQVVASSYRSDDYKTGDDAIVHSAYKRESVSLIGTLTPTSSTAIEFDVDLGRGNASYADRTMDARTFDRTSYNLPCSSILMILLIGLICEFGTMP